MGGETLIFRTFLFCACEINWGRGLCEFGGYFGSIDKEKYASVLVLVRTRIEVLRMA